MPQIFDVTANENARYKRNELELSMAFIQSNRRIEIDTIVKAMKAFI